MKENKYVHLLDKYIDGGNKYSSSLLSKEERKAKTEGKNRYGNLLDNTERFPTIYDKMLNVENALRESNRKEAEKEARRQQDIKEKHEREERELQARREQNTAFVEDYLAEKKAKQEAIEKKKKEEAEKAEIYKKIERLMQISPEAAKAYADIYANKLKMI